MLPRHILKMEPLGLAKMHFLLIVKISLPMLVCTDVLMLDVPILTHGIKNNILFGHIKNQCGPCDFLKETWIDYRVTCSATPQVPRLL